MEHIVIIVLLAALGLVLGSFAGAQVWRLRAYQLMEDKKAGEKVDAHELESLQLLTKQSFTSDRSVCLHCKRTLHWYDLLPLLSWLSVRGKCRYCKKKIGIMEPLIELGVAAFFVASYVFWPDMLTSPLAIMHFALWCVAGVLLAILFAYDMKWFLLPNKIVFPLIGLAAVIAGISIASMTTTPLLEALINLSVSIVILSGLYLLLWKVSNGQWIGFGDVKLGLALALLLVDWQLAFLALFAANLIGCLIVIPGMLAKKITRKTRVPFGPLLIAGAIIAKLFGDDILAIYFISIMS